MVEEKKIWFIKLHTDYTGTDNTYLEFGEKPDEKDLYCEAKEHAQSYEYIWWHEEEDDFDSEEEYWEAYEQTHDEQAHWIIEEYEPEKHDGHLYNEEVEKAKKWMDELDKENKKA
ncbi:MAG: hypothetical protein GF317_24575 [Candidatus Lokiarchaeota archaeon]|nr:hypothetical protein [Candidatus Lokiarchaeota archaeon]